MGVMPLGQLWLEGGKEKLEKYVGNRLGRDWTISCKRHNDKTTGLGLTITSSVFYRDNMLRWHGGWYRE